MPSYYIIKCKKPTKQQIAANPNQPYYAGFRIDKDSGPYWENNNWCIDTKFWFKKETYAIAVSKILDDEHQEVHDIIIKNIDNKDWNAHFLTYFAQRSPPQPLLHSKGDIICSDGRYIGINWTADQQHSLCWDAANNPYYKRKAMLYGGQEINAFKSIQAQRITFVNGPSLYASNACEFVAYNFCNDLSKLLSLSHHHQKLCMIDTLYLHLKKIRVYWLKHHKYGFEKDLKIPIPYRLFVPFMTDILQKRGINYEQTKHDLFFNLNDVNGNAIFGESLFSKMFGDDKVFAYSIQFIHTTKSEQLSIKFYVLQQNIKEKDAPLLGYEVVDE